MYSFFYSQPATVTVCIPECPRVYKWRRSQPHRQKGQRICDSSTLCRTFSLACWYPFLLSPRQHDRGQYSIEHRHYSGQWLGLICHEYKENHFQEQSLQLQSRVWTQWRTFSEIPVDAGMPVPKPLCSSCTKDNQHTTMCCVYVCTNVMIIVKVEDNA